MTLSIIAAMAQGIVQHHHDDAWFHATPAFNELSLIPGTVVPSEIPTPYDDLLVTAKIDWHRENADEGFAGAGEGDRQRSTAGAPGDP